jgi:hypothetical protein
LQKKAHPLDGPKPLSMEPLAIGPSAAQGHCSRNDLNGRTTERRCYSGAMSKPGPGALSRIDLAEAHRLLSALERDLHRVEEGEGDVSALREEVKALAELLENPSADRSEVHEGLHAVRGRLDDFTDTAVGRTARLADYVARIGRMLGM